MKNLTLKQLRYFEAVAQQRHFGRAAEVCAISQPALSVQIRELEHHLGQPLFERGARQVHLTGFGEDFAPRAGAILRAVDELGEFARAAQSAFAGRFRLGVIPTIAPYLLPRLIGDLAVSHPGLELHVRETVTPRLLEELGQGAIDAAILALPSGGSGFEEVPLFEEDFVLVRPGTDADVPAPDVTALSEMRMLLLEEGHCFRDQALALCGLRGAADRTVPQTRGLDGSSLTTLVQMVGAGIGVTLIPQMAVPVETRSARVTCSPLKGQSPGRRVGMIWRKNTPLDADLRTVADVVRQTGNEAAAGVEIP